MVESVAENALTGQPVSLTRRPCAYARNLGELENLDPEKGSQEFSCNYSLGERLFHDLYRNLDDTTFRQGFRNLYLKSQVDDADDDCEGDKLDICHVEAAFKANAPAEAAATVDRVIARWYDGSEPYDTSYLDTGPVDPKLPSNIKGHLTRAYIALDKDRPKETKTDRFSANKVRGRVYLYLHFSSISIGEQQEFPYTIQEFPYTIVEDFEDGFTYNRRNRTSIFKTGWTSSWSRSYIGQSRERKWATGRYWVYVYHEGRKMAEVEFEVTP